MAQDLYDVLGVRKTDGHDVIKKAYRKLARQTHPDRNKDNPKAEKRFKEVSSAWDTLGDKDKREMYDTFGDASTKPGFNADQARAYRSATGGRGRNVDFGGGNVDLGDLLGGMFGMGGGGKPGFNSGFGPGTGGLGGSGFSSGFGPSPGQDMTAKVSVPFEMSVLGGEYPLVLSDGRNIKIRIPAGVRDGEALKLRGQGGRGQQGGRNGDLRITIQVHSHPRFRRDGLNLLVDVDITVVDAMRGGKVVVPTLQGDVKLTIKPGVQSGQKMRLSGKGVTRRQQTGDLLAVLHVKLPSHVPEDVLDALQQAYDTDADVEMADA
ncbi:MAG: molecular chaperone DnaJ [Myxococcota bacterium]|jgi:molecular chaperone DnaJ